MTDIEVYRKPPARTGLARWWGSNRKGVDGRRTRTAVRIWEQDAKIRAVPDVSGLTRAQASRLMVVLVDMYPDEPFAYAVHCYVQGAKRSAYEAALLAAEGADTQAAVTGGYKAAHDQRTTARRL